MKLKQKFEDYTEEEFVSLMVEIFKENVSDSDERLDVLLEHFEKITCHPEGSDLIYYTANDEDCNPEGITRVIKEWRELNNLPLFKS